MEARSLASLVATMAMLAGAAACGADGTGDAAVAAGPVRSLVVDTDLAADDLVALAFLLSSPRADVRAITVSGTGEVRCPAGLEVVRGLLAVTGDDDVPVACGRSVPLRGDHAFPAEWRDSADDAWGAELPVVDAERDPGSATELLTRTLEDGDTTLVALGPLTDVAEAFRARPRLARQVPSVVVMGGALDVPGNVFLPDDGSPSAEWNVYVDPTAAAEVIDSGVPVTLVALDATNRAPITDDFVEELRDVAGAGAGELAAEVLADNPLVTAGEAFFWDPLAAAVALDPGLVDTEDVPLSVVVDHGEESGRTVRDESGSPVLVATGVDREELERLLLSTLG